MRLLEWGRQLLALEPMVELWTVARFGVIGLLATAVHLLVASLCFLVGGLQELPANILAFAVAFPVSYFGHRYFTFRTAGSAIRFLMVSGASFVANNTILVALLEILELEGVYAITAALVLTPVMVFLLSRYWVFGNND